MSPIPYLAFVFEPTQIMILSPTLHQNLSDQDPNYFHVDKSDDPFLIFIFLNLCKALNTFSSLGF